MTAPKTPEERARMVEDEAKRRCLRESVTNRHLAYPDCIVPCGQHTIEAERAIPPVAPALGEPMNFKAVTAAEYMKGTVAGYRVAATLRHYEAEVGRLEAGWKAALDSAQRANDGWAETLADDGEPEWEDAEPCAFDTKAEAEQAIADRKASLLAPTPPTGGTAE